jgi:hypothetical protein
MIQVISTVSQGFRDYVAAVSFDDYEVVCKNCEGEDCDGRGPCPA